MEGRPMRKQSSGGMYRQFCLADRPNHLRILKQAAEETDGFGVLSQATVSDSVEDLVAELDVPVIVDCGAFAEDDFDGTLIDLADTYQRMGADYGLIPDVIGDREGTDDSVAHATRLWQRGHPRWSFEPVAVAQGQSPREYASSYWDCYQMGADRIAVGGLLDTDGKRSGGHATGADDLFEVLRYIRDSHPRIWSETWTFALGCDHPDRRPRFRTLGVNAADSKRWLFQYDQSSRKSRDDQLTAEVVRSATQQQATLLRADGGRNSRYMRPGTERKE